jgi:hypothetical protein
MKIFLAAGPAAMNQTDFRDTKDLKSVITLRVTPTRT